MAHPNAVALLQRKQKLIHNPALWWRDVGCCKKGGLYAWLLWVNGRFDAR